MQPASHHLRVAADAQGSPWLYLGARLPSNSSCWGNLGCQPGSCSPILQR